MIAALPQSLVLLAFLSVGLGCRRTDFCAGAPTCFGAEAAQCRNVPGCLSAPVCVLDPLRGVDCSSPSTEVDCMNSGDCTWSAGLCGESCGRIPDLPSCVSTPSCVWSACSGRARACRLYSADQCPISPIGCYVDPGN